LSLPKGVFIMSNIFDAPGQPTCAESVSPVSGKNNGKKLYLSNATGDYVRCLKMKEKQWLT
jgi:hypothetical protein